MMHKNPLDYMLYDNVTLNGGSRDWGLKNTTGWLLGSKEARRSFQRYCHTLLNKSRCPFMLLDRAVGGFPIHNQSNSYVLCVSISQQDKAGRDSVAIVGIGFSSNSQLRQYLQSFDPIETARQALGSSLPDKLTPAGSRIELVSDTIYGGQVIHDSDPQVSLGTVVKLLSELNKSESLPSILSKSCQCDKSAWGDYEMVFCHPLDARAEEQLETYISHQNQRVAVHQDSDLGLTQGKASGHKKKTFSKYFKNLQKTAVFVVSLMMVVIVTWIISSPVEKRVTVTKNQPNTDMALNFNHHKPSPRKEFIEKSESAEQKASLNVFPDRISELKHVLNELKALETRKLKETRVYQTAYSIDVLPEYEESRSEILNQLENVLPKRRDSILQANLDYYFNQKEVHDIPRQELWEQEIVPIVARFKLPEDNCIQLKSAFRREFHQEDSLLVNWCKFLDFFSQLKKEYKS